MESKREIVCGIVLVLLFASLLSLGLKIQSGKGEPTTWIVPDDYPTIQAAIDAAIVGDTIYVRNGTYNEYLSISKPLTLVGENRSAILDWNGETSSTIGIGGEGITAECKITGFTIRNAPSIAISMGGPYNGTVLIIDNTIETSGFGVSVTSAVCVMINNTLTMNTVGLRARALGPYSTLYHNNFINNTAQVNNMTPDSVNFWDNGCEGNFWSNYNGTDLDNDGVGDTFLPWEGVDNYPLMNSYWNPCDISHDLKVDMRDIGVSAKTFGTRPGDTLWNPHVDITGLEPLVSDGKVDMRDISLVARHFGEHYP